MRNPPTQDDTTASGICKYCLKNVCYANKPWDTHHTDLKSLQESAKEQCIFCCTLLEDLQAIDLQSLTWPLHRWNLRRLASTRESEQFVILTFRSIPSNFVSQANLRIESLPDRVFHFYKEEDLGTIPNSNDLDDRTNKPRTLAQIRQWLTDCNKNHPRCGRRRNRPDSVPARLLDISQIDTTPNDVARVRVVLTKDEGVREPYATLSHRWGDSPDFLQLNKTNFSTLTTIGFEWCHPLLPETFKNAILLAREMGLSYIWIDSVCMIQKDPSDHTVPHPSTAESETSKESKLMHLYYTNSFCNISTADSGSGLPGLFRSRNLAAGGHGSIKSTIILPRLVTTTKSPLFGGDTWRIIPDSLWDTQLLSNVLFTRAWVFQERMLSPRILHFSRNQVFWECSTITACEGLPSGLPPLSNTTAVNVRNWRARLQVGLAVHHRPLAGRDDVSMETLWKNAVREYTRCQLTVAVDKLNAIWSVAKLVKDALSEDYQAGLWSGNLEEQLAWKVVDCRQSNGEPCVKIKVPDIPTWSWASLHGMIEPRDRSRGSGALQRVYHVVNHTGAKIAFQTKTGRSRSEPFSIPTLKTFENVCQSRIGETINPTVSTQTATRTADHPPQFEDTRIAIQGYLRDGCLSFSMSTEKWQLKLSIPKVSTEAEDENCRANCDAVTIHDVFPDIEPASTATSLQCSLVVLAYSQEFGATTTFSGIGLILQKVKEAHFERLGSFHFDMVTKEILCFLTWMQDPCPASSTIRQDTICEPNRMRQADKFWLI